MGPSPLFWILALVLVAAILALLVVPLLRRARAEAGPADVEAATAVFRDHKRQLDAELAAGAVTNDEHAAAVAELTRRFGAELESAAPAPVAAGPGRGGFTAALALVALLPVTAGVLYFVLGNPAALAPQTARQGPADSASIEAMVEDLAARLRANPDDGEGWAMLGRSYRVLGRYQASATAYAEAVKRLPPNASLLVDWAEAIAQVQGRSLAGEPSQILERALALEPDSAKALALGGAAAMERGDRAQAIALWTKLRGVLPPGSPQLAQIDAALARAGVTLADGSGSPPAAGTPPAAAGAAAVPPAAAVPGAVGAAAAGVAGASPAVPPAPGAGSSPPPTAAGGTSVTGRVELDPRLAGNVSATDTVFIFARDPDGPRMPLAALKVPAGELPRAFELTDAMAMTPGMTLSRAAKIVVEARVSRSGNAKAASGDLAGTSAPVAPGARDVVVRIDRVVP